MTLNRLDYFNGPPRRTKRDAPLWQQVAAVMALATLFTLVGMVIVTVLGGVVLSGIGW